MRIAQIQLVTTFPVQEKILARMDSVITKLVKSLSARRIIPRNLPTATPPELPRTLIVAAQTIIQIGLNRIEVLITPPEHVSSSAEASIRYFSDVLNGVLAELFNASPSAEWVGAVLTNQYPIDGPKSGTEAVGPSFKQLVNVNLSIDNLSSFNLMYGGKYGNYFRHVTVMGYETSEVPIDRDVSDKPSNSPKFKEAGVQIVLDINNKPMPVKNGAITDLLGILTELQSLSGTVIPELGLQKIIP